MKRKWFLCLFFGIVLFTAMFSISSASNEEFLVFSQKVGAGEQLYVAKSDGSDLQSVCSGNDLTVFFLGNYLFYFRDHQLYDYNFTAKSSRFLARFDESQIFLQSFTKEPGSPEQIMVIAYNPEMNYEYWFVLDLDDGSLRKITRPPVFASQTGLTQSYSPDNSYQIKIRSKFGYRFELELQSSKQGKVKAETLWTLPQKMTFIPEAPVWSPNSEMFAFFGKEFQDSSTFYSLFLYDIKKSQMIPIQEQVFPVGPFARLEMGEFTPDWSTDGKYLIVEYQPFGLPTSSSILKYEVGTGKKTYLAEGPGTKGHPLWSPSGQGARARILFLSKQNGEDSQLFTMNAQGENLIRISPKEGFTQWARWYKPKSE